MLKDGQRLDIWIPTSAGRDDMSAVQTLERLKQEDCVFQAIISSRPAWNSSQKYI